jgi:hypothetical protein
MGRLAMVGSEFQLTLCIAHSSTLDENPKTSNRLLNDVMWEEK